MVFLTGLVGSEEDDVEKTGITVDGLNYQTLGKPYEIDHLLKVVDNALSNVRR